LVQTDFDPATARLYPVAIPNNTCHAEFISASHPNPASAELVCHAEFISASHPNPASARLYPVAITYNVGFVLIYNAISIFTK
jgi:hypothetical protein